MPLHIWHFWWRTYVILIPTLAPSSHISSPVTKYLFLSAACHSSIFLKNGEMGRSGTSMWTVKTMSLYLMPLFDCYTFIKKSNICSKTPGTRRERGDGRHRWYWIFHLVSQNILLIIWLSSQPDTFCSCFSPWLYQIWQL